MEWSDCPLVEINPQKQGGAPLVKGTRAPVSAVLNNHASGSSDQEIAENFGIPADTVRAILAFAAEVQSSALVR
jgi:uncharacterized protein (DUF433 family)